MCVCVIKTTSVPASPAKGIWETGPFSSYPVRLKMTLYDSLMHLNLSARFEITDGNGDEYEIRDGVVGCGEMWWGAGVALNVGCR